jgi:hypothetical protein
LSQPSFQPVPARVSLGVLKQLIFIDRRIR